jgi:hypothetical protein
LLLLFDGDTQQRPTIIANGFTIIIIILVTTGMMTCGRTVAFRLSVHRQRRAINQTNAAMRFWAAIEQKLPMRGMHSSVPQQPNTTRVDDDPCPLSLL